MLSKKSVIYFLFLFFSCEFLSDSVNKVTYASWSKPDVEILYVLPKEINENTKVLFIIHGNSRDVEKYLNQWIEPSKDKNVIILAHNSVIGTHLFKRNKLVLEEGGFYVLSIKNNKLVLEHEFHNFNSFSKHFFIRNHNL